VLGKLNVDQSEVRTLTQQQQAARCATTSRNRRSPGATQPGSRTLVYRLTDSFRSARAAVPSVEDAVAQAEHSAARLKPPIPVSSRKALAAAVANACRSLAFSGDYQVIGTKTRESTEPHRGRHAQRS